MKKWMLLALLTVTHITMQAQETFAMLFERVNDVANSTLLNDAVRSDLAQACEAQLRKAGVWDEGNEEKIREIVKEYYDTQFELDLTKLSIPYYEGVITKSELRRYATLISEPKVKTAMGKIAGAVLTADVMEELMVTAFSTDFKAEKRLGSESFKKTYDKYYKAANVKETVDDIIRSIRMGVQQQDVEVDSLVMDVIVKHLKKALPIAMNNAMVNGGVTTEDLHVVLELMQMPEYQAMQKGNQALAEDMGKVMRQLNDKAMEYVKTRLEGDSW
ncbi:MAG: hypothetical protein HUK03_09815 [Bacteroidaceae bacterium]|nr:hypothetical protein [Bacteroidaceae bacterium]